MSNLRKIKEGLSVVVNKIFVNKKLFFSVLAIVLFLFVYTVFVRGYINEQEEKKIAKQIEVKQAENKTKKEEKLKNAKFSRITFFLVSPVRASLAVPDYIEGNYRVKEEGNKMSFLYIKDSDFISPIFYIKYEEKDRLILENGEKKLLDVESKKDGKMYSFVYHIFLEDSYKGESKEGFSEIIWDIENILIDSLKVF